MHADLANRIAQLEKTGAIPRPGRPPKDPEMAEFFEHTRLRSAAIKTMPSAWQKAFLLCVRDINADVLESHAERGRRAAFSRFERHGVCQLVEATAIRAAKRVARLNVVANEFDSLLSKGVRPTSKVVYHRIQGVCPELSDVSVDTVRKDIAQIRRFRAEKKR